MKLATSQSGNGTHTLVFLHGFCETKEIWKDFITPFESNFRCLCIDLPGFGKSEGLADTTIPKVAEAVYKHLKEENLQNITLIGHSLGGYVALSLAKQFPERIKNIVLFHSSVFADGKEKKENRNKTIAFVRKNGVPAFAKTFAPSLYANPDAQKDAVKKTYQMASHTSVETHVAYSEAMRDREDFSDWVQVTDIPFFFIVGKQDGAVPLEKSKEQMVLPKKSKSLVLEGVGHMGIVEAPTNCQEFLLHNMA